MARRERKKQQKRDRIIAAARDLFAQQGYHGTTTRQIAAAADIGVGTLFAYFPDKRALLNVLFAEEIAQVSLDAFAGVAEAALILDQLMTVFHRIYLWYEANPSLGRLVVGELLLQSPKDDWLLVTITATFVNDLSRLIAAAVARGELIPETPAMVIATSAFSHYHLALVSFLSQRLPSRESAERILRDALDWNLRGVRRSNSSEDADG